MPTPSAPEGPRTHAGHADSRLTKTVSFAALRHPHYRVYFIASALAMMADNIEHVISYWVLFERFHAPCWEASPS